MVLMFMFFLWDNSGDDLLEGGLISAGRIYLEEANIRVFICIDLLWKTTYATQRIH